MKNIRVVRLTVATIAALLSLGCGHAKISPPDISLMPATYRCDDCPPPPFVARYERRGKRLSYIAARHESGLDSATFALIRAEFAARPPQLVIVEGIPRNAGDNSPAFVKLINSDPLRMESYYAASLALAGSAVFAGGEPAPQEIKQWLLSKGYTEKDIFGYSILTEIPVWRRQGGAESFSGFYSAASRNAGRMYKLTGAALMSESELAAWYSQRNKKQLDSGAITIQETAPYNAADSLFTQKMDYQVARVRDAAVCRAIAEGLNRFDRVLVVYGAGHFGMEQKILRKMLGRPVLRTASGP